MENKNMLGGAMILLLLFLLFLIIFTCYLCPLCLSGCDGGGGVPPLENNNFTCSDPGLEWQLENDNHTIAINGVDYRLEQVLNIADSLIANLSGARVVTTPTMVGLEDELGRIPCDIFEYGSDNDVAREVWLFSSDLCESWEGHPTCTDEFVGCVCNKQTYSGKCAYIIDDSDIDDAFCTGFCEDSTKCKEIEDSCICVELEQEPEQSTPCELMDVQMCTEGECPPGQFCSMDIGGVGCSCWQIPL